MNRIEAIKSIGAVATIKGLELPSQSVSAKNDPNPVKFFSASQAGVVNPAAQSFLFNSIIILAKRTWIIRKIKSSYLQQAAGTLVATNCSALMSIPFVSGKPSNGELPQNNNGSTITLSTDNFNVMFTPGDMVFEPVGGIIITAGVQVSISSTMYGNFGLNDNVRQDTFIEWMYG